jgi:phage terminase large subunit GpA-like protein
MKSGDVRAEVEKLWAPPPRQTVCEWARDNFAVTTGAKKGRFIPNAYQVEPINAIGDPWVNEIVIMAATQMLKTMVILVGITQLCMHFRLRPAVWRALSSRFGQVANVVHGAPVFESK